MKPSPTHFDFPYCFDNFRPDFLKPNVRQVHIEKVEIAEENDRQLAGLIEVHQVASAVRRRAKQHVMLRAFLHPLPGHCRNPVRVHQPRPHVPHRLVPSYLIHLPHQAVPGELLPHKPPLHKQPSIPDPLTIAVHHLFSLTDLTFHSHLHTIYLRLQPRPFRAKEMLKPLNDSGRGHDVVWARRKRSAQMTDEVVGRKRGMRGE